MYFANFRNYEIINKYPKISYIEADYLQTKNEYEKCVGYVKQFANEKMYIYSADRKEKQKCLIKKSIIKNIQHPIKRLIIKL